MPLDGMNRDEYLNNKFGGKEKALMVYKKIKDEGKLANIHFQFRKIKITPNSLLSHKLLAFAFSKQKQNEVLESIFYQYFIEGKNIGNIKILVEIAKQTKTYEDNIEHYLLSFETLHPNKSFETLDLQLQLYKYDNIFHLKFQFLNNHAQLYQEKTYIFFLYLTERLD